MNVSLTRELARMVKQKVKSGLYNSASEVVREALRLLIHYDQDRQHDRADLNRKIDLGLAQLDRGEGISAADSRRRVRLASGGRQRV